MLTIIVLLKEGLFMIMVSKACVIHNNIIVDMIVHYPFKVYLWADHFIRETPPYHNFPSVKYDGFFYIIRVKSFIWSRPYSTTLVAPKNLERSSVRS